MVDYNVIKHFIETRTKLKAFESSRKSLSESFLEIKKSFSIPSSNTDGIFSSEIKDRLEKGFVRNSENYTKEVDYYNNEIKKCESDIESMVAAHDYLYQIPSTVKTIASENFLEKSKVDIKDFYEIEICGTDDNFKLYVSDIIAKSEKEDDDIDPEKMENRFSDAIIINDEGKILMVKRVDNDDHLFPNKWGLPGGHIEKNETAESAAIRETKEEINIDVTDAVSVLDYIDEESSTAIHYFLCQADHSSVLMLEGSEISNFMFASKEERKELDVIPGLNEILDDIDTNMPSNIALEFLGYSDDNDDDDESIAKAKGEEKVSKVMREYKKGKLKSSSGEKVTDRKQAIAIALSEAGISKGYEPKGKSIKKGKVSKEHLAEMIKEHERLVGVLESVSELNENAKKEYDIQKKELDKYKEQYKKLENKDAES